MDSITKNIVTDLQQRFRPAHRYANFGATLRSLQICGFRGIDNLQVDLRFPVTAISGLNGAGKSTVGQLAMCAYRRPSTAIGYKRFYVASFFPSSVADPSPFGETARVVYTLETNQQAAPQTITVARATSEWSGYKRQPERYCFYIGFTVYIPKIERRDLSVYGGKNLQLGVKREVTEGVREKVTRILNQPYQDVHFQGITHGKRKSEVGVVQKFGKRYSENNMGFGEGRLLYIVSLMEEAPVQSLFVLEEPETSLHEEAQVRFAEYLLEVCKRRSHQILFSTHSSFMMEALPTDARLLLYRDSGGVQCYNGISSTRARAILSGGAMRSLIVCVEDSFAADLLRELIRITDKDLLKAIEIHSLGSKEAVLQGVRLLNRLQKKALGVRDGDVGSSLQDAMFSLPGTEAPEREVFSTAAVKAAILDEFHINVDQVRETAPDPNDHHAFVPSCRPLLKCLPR